MGDPMKLRPFAYAALASALALLAAPSRASAATCNVTACTNEIQAAAGLVVNDVFRDTKGLTYDKLPIFGKVFNNWPGCAQQVDFAGAGHSNAPYDCPGQYVGDVTTPTPANAQSFLGAVDRYWWQPCRLADGSTHDIGGGTICPTNWACIADGTGGNYNPWEGLVFDLGGPSNKVAIFAENDHGPQPCESLEYTVFLSDNPFARDMVLDPKTTGVDRNKWNRAVLSKIFTKGFVEIRTPDPAGHGAACGDVAAYSVEEDSFVQVFSLPCGITFRYAAIVAGNDGRDFPSCAYDSNEGEIDAVAGLTESGAGVCPDADGDLYVDCSCGSAPAICDCNDGDPTIHPGAPETCDTATDKNCDKKIGGCDADLVCNASVCVPKCGSGEVANCPPGSECTDTGTNGKLCVPKSCASGGCPAGSVCTAGGCVAACDGTIKCPGSQVCQDGRCVDPCAHVTCPAGTTCNGGKCEAPCGCFASNTGCSGSQVCDTASTQCVAPACKGVTCGSGETCDPTTGKCASFCNSSVKCPSGQKCVSPDGCVPICTGVTCDPGLTCNPNTGACEDHRCDTLTCFPPEVCVAGTCVTPDDAGTDAGEDASVDAGDAGDAGGGTAASPKGGCGCDVPGNGGGTAALVAALALGLAVVARRRK
jgi:MYXO-CTERM domain-containing protein